MKFTKSNVRKVHEAINKAIKKAGVADKFNIEIEPAGGSVGELESTLKFKISRNDDEAEEQRKESYKEAAKTLGLPEDIIGRKFDHKKSTYEIVRIDLNKKKYPVIVKNQNGTGYKFPVSMIRQKLGLDLKS